MCYLLPQPAGVGGRGSQSENIKGRYYEAGKLEGLQVVPLVLLHQGSRGNSTQSMRENRADSMALVHPLETLLLNMIVREHKT